MKLLSNFAPALALAACAAVLGLSAYPGLLTDLLLVAVYTSFVWVPALALVALALVVLARVTRARRGATQAPAARPARIVAATAVLVATLVLLLLRAPLRLGFRASRGPFDALLEAAPSAERGTLPLDRRLGIYTALDYAADPRGGLFVRVRTSPDGPDLTSHGFAHAPNPDGTPFGAADYVCRPVGGGWHAFRVSSDRN